MADALYNILVSQYRIKISSKAFKDLIAKQTETLYKQLVREDANLPRVRFSLPDQRAMGFLKDSDMVYLGRYITSPELKARVVDYIREAYLENGTAIGNSPKELNAFMSVFKDELDLSRSQVRLIIDTTVSRARVFGQVNGLRAAAARTFEIAGPDDNLTCSYCREMLGREFDVATEIRDQDRLITSGPEAINSVKPFLKGSISLEDLEAMADEAVQAAGFAAPPYHGHCRHRLVAKSFYENLDEVPYSID